MANEAIAVSLNSVPVDSQVVEFFSQLSYLRGYKAALFDSKIRFQTTEKEVLKRWNLELEAVSRLINYFSNVLVQNRAVSLDDIESHLLEALAVDKSNNQLDADGVEAMRHAVERAIGIVVELKRTSAVSEAA